jgi:hypothetical protein
MLKSPLRLFVLIRSGACLLLILVYATAYSQADWADAYPTADYVEDQVEKAHADDDWPSASKEWAETASILQTLVELMEFKLREEQSAATRETFQKNPDTKFSKVPRVKFTAKQAGLRQSYLDKAAWLRQSTNMTNKNRLEYFDDNVSWSLNNQEFQQTVAETYVPRDAAAFASKRYENRGLLGGAAPGFDGQTDISDIINPILIVIAIIANLFIIGRKKDIVVPPGGNDFSYGSKTLHFDSVSGQVISTDKREETIVWSEPGSTHVSGNTVHRTAARIFSRSVTHHEFCMQEADGFQQNVQLTGPDIPLSENQDISVLAVNEYPCAILNRSTDTLHTLDDPTALNKVYNLAPVGLGQLFIPCLIYITLGSRSSDWTFATILAITVALVNFAIAYRRNRKLHAQLSVFYDQQINLMRDARC